MNIDERLAALVERHEALTGSVELLAAQQAEAAERAAAAEERARAQNGRHPPRFAPGLRHGRAGGAQSAEA